MSLSEGRHLWSGYLADDNVERVAELIGQVFPVGTRYQFVGVNESFGHRPELRAQTVKSIRVYRLAEDKVTCGVSIDGDSYLTGVYTRLATPPGFRDPEPDKFDSVRIDITDRQVTIEHYAPSRAHLWWVFKLYQPEWCDECSAVLVPTCPAGHRQTVDA